MPEPGRDSVQYAAERVRLIASLSERVEDRRVLCAMERVPREQFVPGDNRPAAYVNAALSIGRGQTISQPLIVAQMTAAIRPRSSDRVLEVGAGSGYQAAVLSLLVAEVVTVERIPELAESARRRLARLGYDNVRVETATDELGWPAGAPYDGILVAAAAPALPQGLLRQLRTGGRLVVPVGGPDAQELILATTTDSGHTIERLGACAFVPLIGPGGWPAPG